MGSVETNTVYDAKKFAMDMLLAAIRRDVDLVFSILPTCAKILGSYFTETLGRDFTPELAKEKHTLLQILFAASPRMTRVLQHAASNAKEPQSLPHHGCPQCSSAIHGGELVVPEFGDVRDAAAILFPPNWGKPFRYDEFLGFHSFSTNWCYCGFMTLVDLDIIEKGGKSKLDFEERFPTQDSGDGSGLRELEWNHESENVKYTLSRAVDLEAHHLLKFWHDHSGSLNLMLSHYPAVDQALIKGNFKTVKILTELGAKFVERSNALPIAAELCADGKLEQLRFLHQEYPSFDFGALARPPLRYLGCPEHGTCYAQALLSGNLEVYRFLTQIVKVQEDPRIQDIVHNKRAHLACTLGPRNAELVRWMLDNDPSGSGIFYEKDVATGESPIFDACRNEEIDIVKCLIQKRDQIDGQPTGHLILLEKNLQGEICAEVCTRDDSIVGFCEGFLLARGVPSEVLKKKGEDLRGKREREYY